MTNIYDEPTRANLPAVSLPNMRIVVFQWQDTGVECYDCGLPAVYELVGQAVELCSVCAAQHAADGETIERFWHVD